MTNQKGICTRLDDCELAEKREIITIPAGAEFICPNCGKKLMAVKQGPPLKRMILAACGLLVASAAGAGLFLWPDGETLPPVQTAITSSAVAAAPVPAVDPADILAKLESGAFEEVRKLLDQASASPELAAIAASLRTRAAPEIRFQRMPAGKAPEAPLPLESPELKRLRMTHADSYRILVRLPDGLPRQYLYIFQKDHFNKLQRVFPDPVYGGGNPVNGGEERTIPPGEKDWLYLDELASEEMDAIPETIYVVCAPWDARDLNGLYGQIHEATEPERIRSLMARFHERLLTRRDAGVPAVFYAEFGFSHTRPADS